MSSLFHTIVAAELINAVGLPAFKTSSIFPSPIGGVMKTLVSLFVSLFVVSSSISLAGHAIPENRWQFTVHCREGGTLTSGLESPHLLFDSSDDPSLYVGSIGMTGIWLPLGCFGGLGGLSVEIVHRKLNGPDPLNPNNYSASFNVKHVYRDFEGKKEELWLTNWATPQIVTLESGKPIVVRGLYGKPILTVEINE